MNRLLLILPVLLSPFLAISQQLPLFTQYRSNQSLINPASINSDFFTFEQNISFGGSYRSQWTGLDAAPETQTLWGEYYQANRSGVSLLSGGYLINDRTGPTGFTGLYGRIGGVLSENSKYNGVAFALNLGLVQFRVDGTALRLREDNDVVANEAATQLFPDVGLGIFAYTALDGGFFDDDYVFGGISVPQVFGLDLEFENPNGTFRTRRVQHVYANAGIYHFLNDESFLEATTWIKYAPNAPINADVNLRYQMQQNFWAGFGVSTAANMHVEAGFILGDNVGLGNTLKIGYGFDYSISNFGPYVGSTHELNISFAMER